jgi:uncharacterized protein YecT (DUF1311 family)
MEPQQGSGVQRSVRSLNWTMLALIGALIILVLLIVYFTAGRNSDQDKLTQNELAQNQQQNPQQPAKAHPPEKLCASEKTYDLIKRELFRRAAQLRGTDQAAFDQLSGYSVVRMENPVMESQDSATGGVNCSGSVSIDLPPGVAAAGGRRTLSSDVDYTVQEAADGSGTVVILRNADAIVTPLASLARVGTGQPPAAQAPEQNAMEQPQGNVAAPGAPNREIGRKSVYPGRPSFECSSARSKGEIAVCSDTGLSALDQNMATQYRRALATASPEQKDLLQRTRERFVGYRDRCPNRSCIADAYVGRMREIRDIMEGRWQPQR